MADTEIIVIIIITVVTIIVVVIVIIIISCRFDLIVEQYRWTVRV